MRKILVTIREDDGGMDVGIHCDPGFATVAEHEMAESLSEAIVSILKEEVDDDAVMWN